MDCASLMQEKNIVLDIFLMCRSNVDCATRALNPTWMVPIGMVQPCVVIQKKVFHGYRSIVWECIILVSVSIKKMHNLGKKSYCLTREIL